MTLQQLIYFREVAETLHFTKAAQNLYITQSALSYAIAALETELSVPLFIRENGKNIRLTSFGNVLLPLAEKTIDGFRDIEETIRMLRNPLSGVVSIAYSFINCNRFIPKMFSAFSTLPQFEELSVNFEINHKRIHFENDVVLGNIDLAFSCTKFTEGLEVMPFAKQELFVMLPPQHPFASRDKLTVEDISSEILIGYDQGRNLDTWIQKMFAAHGLKPNYEKYSLDWVEQLSQVSLGKGLAILPTLPFEPELVAKVPLDDEMHIRDIYMMWAANRKLPPAVEYVRDCCLNFFDKPPLV